MIGLRCAGESPLHATNEYGICKYCGRLSEEISAGNFKCFRKKGLNFKGTQYIKAPRHPLFLDSVKVIRNCGYCQRKNQGFCKRHNDLKQFLESEWM